MTWQPADVLRAMSYGVVTSPGYTCRGLGLVMISRASPKGRRPPCWIVIHLGSGHSVAEISGTIATAFPIASELAECGDWDFEGLDGWRNHDPDLPQKLVDFCARHPKHAKPRAGGGGHSDVARQIAMARA